MTAKKKETAEQKLLKMIEASGGGALLASKQEQKANNKQNLLAVMKMVNMILIVLIILGTGLLVYQIQSGIRLTKQKIIIDIPAVKKESPKASLPVVTSLDTYMKNVRYRNIFAPYEKAAAVASTETTNENRAIVKMTKNLRLVGVAWLDTVESASVMIEDKDKKATYFLMKGEKLGDLTIKNIYADSVELSYKNEEITLKYDKAE